MRHTIDRLLDTADKRHAILILFDVAGGHVTVDHFAVEKYALEICRHTKSILRTPNTCFARREHIDSEQNSAAKSKRRFDQNRPLIRAYIPGRIVAP